MIIGVCSCVIYPQTARAQALLSEVGVGAKVSPLGIGVEGAVGVTDRSNVRAGFNFFNYSRTFNSHGIHYDGDLDLRSFQITYDYYLLRGVHVSPSLLAYNGNHADANALVPPGHPFSLGGTTYFSGQTNPIGGTAKVTVRNVAPAILFGFGNLVPRSTRHLAVNVDLGVVFQGSPTSKLNLTGSACIVNPTTGCLNAATDPMVQQSILKEQVRVDSDVEPFQYLPVVSVGISWKW
jgi:hypothetical protein